MQVNTCNRASVSYGRIREGGYVLRDLNVYMHGLVKCEDSGLRPQACSQMRMQPLPAKVSSEPDLVTCLLQAGRLCAYLQGDPSSGGGCSPERHCKMLQVPDQQCEGEGGDGDAGQPGEALLRSAGLGPQGGEGG